MAVTGCVTIPAQRMIAGAAICIKSRAPLRRNCMWHGDSGQRQDVRVASDAIVLPDGKRLTWHEFGDPDGSPVIYTAGTPVSGLIGGWYDEMARAAGLRWISPDKPGYGGSDYQGARSLISWSDDLAEPAGHLGLDSFALAGESGGAPFTLAAARQLAGG